MGYVTVEASFKFYTSHILDRARFYHDLSVKVFGKEIKHTLLIHHSLLNALFLKDLISELTKDKMDKLRL